METKTSWHSCRLVVHRDSGRLKWCIGHERTWKTCLKILVFIPAILLPITVICILVSQFNALKSEIVQDENPHFVTELENAEENIPEEERDALKAFRTSFVPRKFRTNQDSENRNDHKRDRRHINYLDNTFYDYDLDALNMTSYESMEPEETEEGLTWRVVNKRIDHHDDVYNDTMEELSSLVDAIPNEIDLSMHRSFLEEKYTPQEIRKVQGMLMRRYMKPDVDPCQDFYRYACGNWDKYNPIPSDRTSYDTFEMLRENLFRVLKDVLSKDVDEEIKASKYRGLTLNCPKRRSRKRSMDHDEIDAKIDNMYYFNKINDTVPTFLHPVNMSEIPMSAIIKVKYFFRSCMNMDLINKRGAKPLLKLLKYLGGWPMINDYWNETDFDWLLLVGQLRLFNNDVLISQWIGPDIKKSDEYIIQIDQASLGLPTRDYFTDSSNHRYLEAYRVYIVQVATLLGATQLKALAAAEEIINFEREVASIMASSDERRNVSEIYSRMTMAEMMLMIPQIDWVRYFGIILNRKISYKEEVVCFSLSYLQRLVQLISITRPRVLANFIMWRFVRHRTNYLDHTFQEVKDRFYYMLYGREKPPSRWQTCVSQVNSNMGMAVGHLFVSGYFDEISKKDVNNMTREIQEAFRELLKTATWLDVDTKHLATTKLDAMKLRIGYPDYILDEYELQERYKDVYIHTDTYFENNLSILQHLARAEQGKLKSSVNKTVWSAAPAVINAYYSRNKNAMMFPAGILQPPFYHRWFPRCLNYGGIGVVIGHEMTHGFDDKGRLFDSEGNLFKWWKDDAIVDFHNRAQCLIDQYNSYTVPELRLNVDGINTQGENIADNGGIKQAFKAYKKWRRNNPDIDESIPGINMTTNQLFFLNFAQVWCGSMRAEAERNKLKSGVHPPGKFRVIGTLSNFPEFSKEFNCSADAAMNPKKKCSVW